MIPKIKRDPKMEQILELKYKAFEEEMQKQTSEQAKQIKSSIIFTENDNIPPNIPDDLFDDIIDYDDLKELLLNALRKNRRMGILLVGPPATAKTMFLYDLLKLKNSMVITAYNASKAGLRDLFLNSNLKYLGIDEIEKADTTTTYTLLSVIENGVVSKTLAGENIIKRVEPIIFASCNNVKKLSEALLSRFTVFYLHPYSRDQLFKVGMYLLDKLNIPMEFRENIVNTILDKGILSDPRDFINILNVTKTNSIDDFKKSLDNAMKYLRH